MMRSADLVGVWMIQSLYLQDCETGQRSEAFGHAPAGTVIFHPDGRMFALITPSNRSPTKSEADRAAAFQKLIAYSGRYRLDPPDRLVTSVDISWFAPWVGTEQLRFCALEGDDLELTSAPLHMPRDDDAGATAFAVVCWKRETARSGAQTKNDPGSAIIDP